MVVNFRLFFPSARGMEQTTAIKTTTMETTTNEVSTTPGKSFRERLADHERKALLFAGGIFWLMLMIVVAAVLGTVLTQKEKSPSGSPDRVGSVSPPPEPSPSTPSASPSQLPDCRTFPARTDFPTIFDWCNLHSGADVCCSVGGERAGDGIVCENWSPYAEYTICKGTCRGASACDGLGSSSASSVSIGINSCQGDSACATVGRDTPGDVTIGAGSCSGTLSCSRVGRNSEATVTIGEGSCGLGKNQACEVGGLFVGVDVTCDHSCEDLGLNAAGNVAVGAGSCTGDSSCKNVGLSSTTTVTIGANSCVNDFACTKLNPFSTTGHTTVGAGSCVGESSCNSIGRERGCCSFILSIEDSACVADKSCERCAETYYDNLITIPGGGDLVIPTGTGFCSQEGLPVP